MRLPIKIAVGEALEVLDMFADESVSIKSVVKDMNDPKKLFTDYSRGFTVPASKQNNRILKHYYNIDLQSSIDSRELIPAKILMNNSTYKVGNIRVEGARISNGVAVHYKITFIGKLSELTRQIGKAKLRDLNFTNLDDDDFDYRAEVINTTKRDLMFPLSSRSERFLADSVEPSLEIEGARNIAYSTSATHLDYGIREQDIVGALSVGAILDKIETEYNFNFTGALEADYIRDLYLWLHQADSKRLVNTPNAIATGFAYSGASNANFTTISNGFVFKATEETNTLGQDRQFLVKVKGTFSGESTIKFKMGGEIIRQVDVSGDYTSNLSLYGDTTDRIFQIEVWSDGLNTVDLSVDIRMLDREYITTGSVNNNFKTWVVKSQHTITAQGLVGTAQTYSAITNMPDMNIMEFLSSLFKMFNIIAEVDNDLNISTKHYDFFMSQGEVKDFTKYIDSSDYDINRPNLYSSLSMKFEEPVLALEQGYKAVNGKDYGSIDYELTGKEGVKLAGSTYDLTIKNQRTPLEPIDNLDEDSDSDFRVCYALFSDLGGTEQTIKPMFTYICRPDTTTGTISDIAFYGNFTTTSGSAYTMPSNVHQRGQNSPVGIYSDVGLYFGNEQSEYRYGFTMNGNGLWNSFYRGTTALMFDEDKRKVKLKAHIPQSQLLLLKLSDTLKISDKFYNINSLETNYLSGVTKLELTLVGDSRIEQFNTDSRNLENESSTDSAYVTYLDATTGEISNILIAPSTTESVSMVGSLIGSSGEVTETFA